MNKNYYYSNGQAVSAENGEERQTTTVKQNGSIQNEKLKLSENESKSVIVLINGKTHEHVSA